MTTYFVSWEVDNAVLRAMSVSESREKTLETMKRVQSQLKSGEMVDWRVFATGGRGYATIECGELELYRRITQWSLTVPWLRVTGAEPIISVEQATEAFASLTVAQTSK